MPVTSAAPFVLDLRETGSRQLPKVITRVTLYQALTSPALLLAFALIMRTWVGHTALLVLSLPIAFLSAAATMLWRRSALRLLREGRLSHGRLVDKKKFAHRGRARYRLTFAYEAEGREYTRRVRLGKTAALEDEALEPLLYLPGAPSSALLLDELPLKPRLEGEQLVFQREAEEAGRRRTFVITMAILVAHLGVLVYRAFAN